MHEMSVDRLPDEMLAAVFARTPCFVLDTKIACVCTRWHRIAKDGPALGRRSCIDSALATARAKGAGGRTPSPIDEIWSTLISPSYKRCMRAAAALGHVICMDHMHDTERPWPLGLAVDAAAKGHLGVLVWLQARGFVFTNGALYAAARCASIVCMAYLVEHGCTLQDDGWSTVCAAMSGSTAAMDWLRDRGCPWHPGLVIAGVDARQVEAATHAVLGGCPWYDETPSTVVYGGHVDLLRAMLDRGLLIDGALCEHAVEGGHDACIALLCQRGAPWSARHCAIAAGQGRLGLVQMLCAAGCPWGAGIFSAATFGGHAHVAAWLRSHGCPCESGAITMAAFAGHLDLLRWLLADGCPYDEMATWMAAMNGHLDALALLYEAGCPWTENACRSAAVRGHLDCLAYAHERGCPIPLHTATAAHINGHVACAAYATAHEPNPPT